MFALESPSSEHFSSVRCLYFLAKTVTVVGMGCAIALAHYYWRIDCSHGFEGLDDVS